MPDEPDPPRKVYGFKERDFKRDNPPVSAGEPPPPTVKELAMMATKEGSSGGLAPSKKPAGPKTDDPNDVYAVLRQNRQHEEKHGLNEVELQQIKSRRKRDFWFVLIGGNLAILAAVALSGFNPVTAIFGLAGLIVFSLGVSWVMWQVMSKY